MKNADLEAKIIKRCKEESIDLDLTQIDIWSPRGKYFNASGCHTCVADIMWGTYNYTDALRAIWKDLQAGLEDCDCERCQGEG